MLAKYLMLKTNAIEEPEYFILKPLSAIAQKRFDWRAFFFSFGYSMAWNKISLDS